jgi:hypothetical protein
MEKKKNGRCFIFSPFLLLFVGWLSSGFGLLVASRDWRMPFFYLKKKKCWHITSSSIYTLGKECFIAFYHIAAGARCLVALSGYSIGRTCPAVKLAAPAAVGASSFLFSPSSDLPPCVLGLVWHCCCWCVSFLPFF